MWTAIKTKMILCIFLLIVTVVAAALVPALYFFSDMLEQEQERAALQGVRGLDNMIEEYKKQAVQYAAIFSSYPDVVRATEMRDKGKLDQIFPVLEKDADLDFITITDELGRVIYRTHGRPVGDSIATQGGVQAALNGNGIASLEHGETMKLAIQAGVSVKNEQGQIVGVLLLGYDAGRRELVDRAKQLFNTETTVFWGDERISTTIIMDGKRVIGTKLSEAVATKVLGEGKEHIGRAEILGIEYMTAYLPIMGSGNKPIGVLFAGESLENFQAARNKMGMVLGFLILCLLVGAISTVTSRLHSELEKAKGQLEKTVLVQTEELRKNFRFTELVLENIPDAIFVKDAKDLRCLRVNKAAEELVGCSRDELVGKTNDDIFETDMAEIYSQTDRQALSQGELFDDPEEPMMTKGQGKRWLHTKKIPLFDAEGKPEYLLAISDDITEIKNAASALQKAANEKRLILNSTSDIIVYHDLDMRVVWANQKAAKEVSRKPEDLVGTLCWDMWYGRKEPCEGCPVLLALHTGQPQAAELTAPNGRERLIHAYPLKNDGGDLIGVAEFSSDITAQKEAETKIAEAKDAIDRASRVMALAVMGGGIAHEINQPLNAIRILTETMLVLMKNRPNVPIEETLKNVRNISRQVDRIDVIVNHLRTFLRNSQNFDQEACNLNAAVEKSLAIIRRQLNARHIRVKKALAEKMPIVYGSSVKFEEVVLNLLMNSMQALEGTEGKRKEIFIKTWVDDNVNLVVSDNGPGISPDDRKKVFEPFFSTKKNSDSMGLGMSIVQSIVTASNGSVRVMNNETGGTVIHISFLINGEESLID